MVVTACSIQPRNWWWWNCIIVIVIIIVVVIIDGQSACNMYDVFGTRHLNIIF